MDFDDGSVGSREGRVPDKDDGPAMLLDPIGNDGADPTGWMGARYAADSVAMPECSTGIIVRRKGSTSRRDKTGFPAFSVFGMRSVLFPTTTVQYSAS